MLVTLEAAREKLWNYGSNVAFASKTQAQSDEWDARLNHVMEELLARCSPRYTKRRINIPIYDEMITLPRQFSGLEGIKLLDTDIVPVNPWMIYGRHFEFAQLYGDVSEGWGSVFPATEMAQTFRIPTPGFYLRCIATAADDPLELVGGRDSNWDEFFDSVNLAITNGTTTTSRYYTQLPQIVKPITTAEVKLYSVDSAGTATLIAIYAPGETVPAYKRFLVPGSEEYPLALCLCRLAYTPATQDNDIVIPSSIRALQRGIRAVIREEAEDEERAKDLWQEAVSFLDSEVTEVEGAEQPTLNVAAGYGPGGIPFII